MDIISKLNTLKSIEPEKSWVVETRKKVLSETPVLGWKVTEIKSKQENKMAGGFFSKKRIGLAELEESNPLFNLSGFKNLFSKRLAVSAFALVFLVSGGAFTVEASKSSLPGDPLYIVKIVSEDATLVVASKEKRSEIEIGRVEKRQEELNKISKNHSDPKQGEKIEMLLGKIETGTDSAGKHLADIKDNKVKARVAKVINIKTEESVEILAKAKENLPDTINGGVLEKFASATKLTEKINFESLAMMAEMAEIISENEEEKKGIVAKVKEKIDKLEEKIIINDENKGSEGSEEVKSTENSDKNDDIIEESTNTVNEGDNTEKGEEGSEDLALEPKTSAEEAKEELEKAKESLENDNLSEALISVNIAVNLIDPESEPDLVGDEPMEDESQGDGEGEDVSDEGEGDGSEEDSVVSNEQNGV